MPQAKDQTPKQRIEAECARRGRPAVIEGCVRLLTGASADDELVRALGGLPAELVLDEREGGRYGYWPRVWAARGLLHAWDDAATPAIIRATADDHWRVREMAAKVIARHQVADAFQAVTDLRGDPVPRVRSAAARATMLLAAAGA